MNREIDGATTSKGKVIQIKTRVPNCNLGKEVPKRFF